MFFTIFNICWWILQYLIFGENIYGRSWVTCFGRLDFSRVERKWRICWLKWTLTGYSNVSSQTCWSLRKIICFLLPNVHYIILVHMVRLSGKGAYAFASMLFPAFLFRSETVDIDEFLLAMARLTTNINSDF